MFIIPKSLLFPIFFGMYDIEIEQQDIKVEKVRQCKNVDILGLFENWDEMEKCVRGMKRWE